MRPGYGRPRMGRGGLWSWTTGGGSCLRVPALHGTRVAPRETRYAHAGGGKVFSFLFRKEKLRPSNERIGKRTHATSQGACIRHRDKRADTQRQWQIQAHAS